MEDHDMVRRPAVAHIDSRPDLDTAARVNEGIAMQRAFGTVAAAAFLRERQVALHVAMRVLTSPHGRRRSN